MSRADCGASHSFPIGELGPWGTTLALSWGEWVLAVGAASLPQKRQGEQVLTGLGQNLHVQGTPPVPANPPSDS